MIRPKYLILGILAAVLLAAAPVSAARRDITPMVERGDPDSPYGHHAGVTAPAPVEAQAQAPHGIIETMCSTCDESGGNAQGACMVCFIMRRFWAAGGWGP